MKTVNALLACLMDADDCAKTMQVPKDRKKIRRRIKKAIRAVNRLKMKERSK